MHTSNGIKGVLSIEVLWNSSSFLQVFFFLSPVLRQETLRISHRFFCSKKYWAKKFLIFKSQQEFQEKCEIHSAKVTFLLLL